MRIFQQPWVVSVLGLIWALSATAVEVERARYDPACGVGIDIAGDELRATWEAGGSRAELKLGLAAGAKLISSWSLDGATVLKDAAVEYALTLGSRKAPAAEERFGYVFFDKPATRAQRRVVAEFGPGERRVAIESAGRRAIIKIGPLAAGTFAGELEIVVYAGSPLLHVRAAMAPAEKGLAYIYDAVLRTGEGRVAYEDLEGAVRRVGSGGEQVTPVAVRWRTIVGEADGGAGSVAVFPAPHAFFYPRDWSNNYKFAQYGQGRFGLRQDPAGGGAFVPWFDAPEGRVQRMDLFLLASKGKAEEAIAAVKRYTRSDVLKPIDGHVTFTSHYHAKLAVNEMANKSTAREFADVFKRMGVDVVHLAEFHGDGHFNDPGKVRLDEMKAMFDLCRTYSDDRLLLIPGEEGVRYLAEPWPPAPRVNPGHWIYLFPKPVYLTWVRGKDVPFVEDVPGYGRVYHVGSREDMVRLLREEKGIAWTTHPRIKASFATPDAFKDQPWFREFWLGAAWKAMPGDLSDDRLGVRCLDLLDDMCNWSVAGGYDLRRLPGEVDVFEIDRTHELWGHMNVNYLKMAKRPTIDDWSGVLDVLRRGDFFTTTGEVLIHDWAVSGGKVRVDAEWTLPLAFAVLATGDGKSVRRQRVDLSGTAEIGRGTFEWPLEDRSAKWVRLELWDVARDGAFTQAQALK